MKKKRKEKKQAAGKSKSFIISFAQDAVCSSVFQCSLSLDAFQVTHSDTNRVLNWPCRVKKRRRTSERDMNTKSEARAETRRCHRCCCLQIAKINHCANGLSLSIALYHDGCIASHRQRERDCL